MVAARWHDATRLQGSATRLHAGCTGIAIPHCSRESEASKQKVVTRLPHRCNSSCREVGLPQGSARRPDICQEYRRARPGLYGAVRSAGIWGLYARSRRLFWASKGGFPRVKTRANVGGQAPGWPGSETWPQVAGERCFSRAVCSGGAIGDPSTVVSALWGHRRNLRPFTPGPPLYRTDSFSHVCGYGKVVGCTA